MKQQMHILLTMFFFALSSNSVSQPLDLSRFDKEDHLDMNTPRSITDSFQIISITPMTRSNIDEATEKLLKYNQRYKEYVRMLRKNKCFVIHIRKNHEVFVIISQQSTPEPTTGKLKEGDYYYLTITPYYDNNFYPKYGICSSVTINSTKYMFDSGAWWFQNLYTSSDLNGCYLQCPPATSKNKQL